ncbi:LysR family transcriptional regulator [Pseudomonas gingeri]|uniref:LysR family transcriptional regulator n=1 Tax=Pseudomonas gingeri TaxID=117681 RepID=A0A7Y8CMW2_9PSED|nr:LysR family transcriptional regulator [Pseudomonas gingeri]NWA01641.1 LysR family transcriptional regulator [Pseudomonas gingeri]NWA13556.1 LysR family transcriptional regulator [Pseudomonas gingeri]NWA53084.1 LysR family transcriptional regulator [Pseudomonas gingeri]NWA96581.1 LysR family transcriptional regulator [Pseudomonas gingeri]NWA99782.1 LysR family transcriptional regulator [Pseudomonas gingeri]
MMNLMHWRLLVAVLDTGTISRAAEQVGMTQSAASQALAAMEEGLGAQLFVREARQAVPTAVGLQVLEEARLMLGSLQKIRQQIDTAKGLSSGTIRLASFPMVLSTLLPPLLRRFRQRHPGIELVALEVSDHEVESMLANELVDVGVVLNPEPGRAARELGRDSWVAVVSVEHHLAARGVEGRVSLAELVAEPFVLATGGCTVNARSIAAQTGLRLEDIQVEVREWNSAFALVRENLGVSLVPELTLPKERKGLRILRLETPVERCFALVASAAGARSAAVAALFDMLD